MLYSTPKNILQERLNNILDHHEETIISDLVKLSLLKRAEKNSDELVFSEIYNLLGLEDFTSLITLTDGKTITFPTKEEFEDALMIVIAYYYRTVEQRPWDEIKDLLGIQDLNSVKLGIQAGQYERFLQKMIKRYNPLGGE